MKSLLIFILAVSLNPVMAKKVFVLKGQDEFKHDCHIKFFDLPKANKWKQQMIKAKVSYLGDKVIRLFAENYAPELRQYKISPNQNVFRGGINEDDRFVVVNLVPHKKPKKNRYFKFVTFQEKTISRDTKRFCKILGGVYE